MTEHPQRDADQPDRPLSASELRARILSHREPPLAVTVEGLETVLLRRATGRDMDALGQLVDQNLSPRTFAEALLRQQWECDSPNPSVLASISDDGLVGLLRPWVQEMPKVASQDSASLADLQIAVAVAYEQWIAPVREIGKRIAQRVQALIVAPELGRAAEQIRSIGDALSSASLKVAPHLAELTRTMQEVSDRMRTVQLQLSVPALDLRRLFESLPDPDQIRTAIEEIRDGADVLNALGYGFTAERWAPAFVRKIGRGRVGHRSVHAAFRDHTRSDEFRAQLKDVFVESSRMRRRWRDLGPALDAHRQRAYALSIPVLLTLLEGMVTDLLVLRGRAAMRGEKVVEERDGRVRLGRDGRPVRLKGLDSKLTTARSVTPKELEDAAGFISDSLIPHRNAILHGRRSGHGRAKLSVQLLLVIWMYAEVIAVAEAGRFS